PQSLTVVGDTRPEPVFGGQHDARLLADGTITLHDNATGTGRPPRAVRIRVDEHAHTATFVDEVTDPEVKQSGYAGSARRLSGGNWGVSWGGTPYIRELTPAGQPVFTLRLADKWFSYRAFPIPRGELRASTLRHAMDVMHPRP